MEQLIESLKSPVTFTADVTLEKFLITKSDENDQNEVGTWVVEGYASTGDLDAQRHIITEDAIKQGAGSLAEYRTVLFNHDPNRPIGKLVDISAHENRLWIKVAISKSEPILWAKIKDGTLSKFSVKGKILGAEKQLQASEDGTPDASKEILIIKSLELYEVSLVSVPANSKARSLMWYIEKALFEADGFNTPIEKDVEVEEVSFDKLKEEFPWLADVVDDIDEDKEEIEKTFPTSLKGVNYIKDATGRLGRFVTIRGRHVFIKNKGAPSPSVSFGSGPSKTGGTKIVSVPTEKLEKSVENNMDEEMQYHEILDVEKFVMDNMPLSILLKDFNLVKSILVKQLLDMFEVEATPVVFKKEEYPLVNKVNEISKQVVSKLSTELVIDSDSEDEFLLSNLVYTKYPELNTVLERVEDLLDIELSMDKEDEELEENAVQPIPDEEYIDLEKFVEMHIPYDTPLQDFNDVKRAVFDRVAYTIEKAVASKKEKSSKFKNLAGTAGRWVTIAGRHVFIGGATAAGVVVGATPVGGALAGVAVTPPNKPGAVARGILGAVVPPFGAVYGGVAANRWARGKKTFDPKKKKGKYAYTN
jgi:HK97 family phage prohead protease